MNAARCFILSSLLISASVATAAIPSMETFVDDLVRSDGFDRQELTAVMAKAEKRQSILDAISRPAEAVMPWWRYRRIFLTKERAKKGLEFWQRNQKTLEDAERRFGVPPEIITAIIGVETLYGTRTGNYPVLDALYTLGFHYPKRADFFRKQLRAFLILARDEGLDPKTPTGSYAGAMGRPQFIPTSYHSFAIDFDGDGDRDIWQDDVDTIGSVANYFSQHHWKKGAPITSQVTGVTGHHQHLIDAGMKPSLSLSGLAKAGLGFDDSLDRQQSASLIALEQQKGLEHWLGLHNFYVITRYNHSNMYAMAAYQLSREILGLRK